ncbi:MAG: penicillin-binding protein 2 [Bacillota bacterium]
MEKKIIEKKMKIFMYILVAMFLLLIGRVAFMQIIDGNRYRTLATQNHQRLITVEAPRGEIIDRNGVRIVSNKPVYTVSLVKLGLDDSGRVIATLSGLLEGDGNFKGMSAKQIEQEIGEKIKGHKRLYEPIRIAANVSQETINKIQEQRLELPGVNIDIEPVRYYPFTDLMGEVLGYVREITNEQLEARKGEGYAMGDSFGQVGLENYYEGYLRGIKGARQVEVDAQGRPVRDLGIKPPVPGNNLILSVDHRLQRVSQEAVAEALKQAKNYAVLPPGKTMSAAAVAMDVNTGEVLAMASLPSYDLNIFSGPLPAKKYNELVSTGALRNHAIQTPYTPGSTFKMVTAVALLESKIVDINTRIVDPGYYKYKNDWKPGGHGIVNVVKALGDSCDTYFYIYGIQAGPELIGKYATEFGLGELTGIDLPGEEAGRTASRELKKKIWAGNDWEMEWREYDSMDMAIGQQESKYTAIQLASYTSTIANGGTIYRPRMVKKVIGPDGSEIKSFSPEAVRKINVSKESMDIVRQGIHEVVGGGTASSVFMGAKYTAAAKTGTAEVGDAAQNSHALFVAYAPFDKPEIAVSVIIEYGAKGSSIAGPVARKIIDGYFQFKKEDAEGKKPTQEQPKAQQQPGGAPAAQGQTPAGAGHGAHTPAGQGQGAGTGATGTAGQPGGTNTTGGGRSSGPAAPQNSSR